MQLTRYRAGHFLTAHDDWAEGLNRVAAYVFNLSADWNVDFGGLLQFIDANGHVQQAYTPRFNSLSLFKVPQLHSVSVVPAYVNRARFALTGWARSGTEQIAKTC